jgi:hypothetical protein
MWSGCPRLAQTDEVALVTDDRAFYQDQKVANGLAANLQAEAASCPNQVRVLASLPDLLDTSQTSISIAADALQRAFFAQYGGSVVATLDRNGFELGQRTEVSFKPFAMKQPASLFVQFIMSFVREDVTQERRSDGLLARSGDCSFEPVNGTAQEIRNVAHGWGVAVRPRNFFRRLKKYVFVNCGDDGPRRTEMAISSIASMQSMQRISVDLQAFDRASTIG